ncbi:MAG: glycosyltransferase [Verrucomicrobia bacterium]|nr:MAG: glycosyltransferase [Verrucomicrobiota bacterium]TAE86055.1 MAG: glycosyltransferase [Verrucomicrobiota bacterium]TAF25844.1 MAG: glycosyltransferase [Verrucomicrobiota bacterium]
MLPTCDSGPRLRWFTCTPVAFGGGPDFFARDSGLLCRGFQALGIESKAVMPLPGGEGDEADLIRTEYANLESVAWWRSLELDGVVLYAWGSPRFRKVAAAIHEAGILLVLNQDNGGLISPLCGPVDWLREQWILSGQGRGGVAWLRFLRLVLRGLTLGLVVTDPLRARHLKEGDRIACVSPTAAGHYRRWCNIWGGSELASRVRVLPHAVEPSFGFRGAVKMRRVACVGRWSDGVQKRPDLLMAVVAELVANDEAVEVVIVGDRTRDLELWHAGLDEGGRRRVRLAGRLDRGGLADLLAASQVFFSPSAFESFGIAAAEALCCGCSVVAAKSVSMASFEWFTGEASGSLAGARDPLLLLRALRAELAAWERGERDPAAIASCWIERLHADRVAAALLSDLEVGGESGTASGARD